MTKEFETVNYEGKEIDFEAAVNLMDDELREELHIQLAPCSSQEFFNKYCEKHFEKYGQEFLLNNEGRLVW